VQLPLGFDVDVDPGLMLMLNLSANASMQARYMEVVHSPTSDRSKGARAHSLLTILYNHHNHNEQSQEEVQSHSSQSLHLKQQTYEHSDRVATAHELLVKQAPLPQGCFPNTFHSQQM
jgi:hypothetical protein